MAFQSKTKQIIFSATETMAWPNGSIDALLKVGLLKPAEPAQIVECQGCEENCPMPVHIFSTEGTRTTRAFIACDKRDDVGRVPVNVKQLQQWQVTTDLLVNTVVQLFGFTNLPQEEVANKSWVLGLLQENKFSDLIKLSIEKEFLLLYSGKIIPLLQVLSFTSLNLKIDKSYLLKTIQHDISSSEWRKQSAKSAADAKHNKPGGSRDKKQQIQAMWATGKYTSRDRCAEEECAELEMSYSTARKALRNTPPPVSIT